MSTYMDFLKFLDRDNMGGTPLPDVEKTAQKDALNAMEAIGRFTGSIPEKIGRVSKKYSDIQKAIWSAPQEIIEDVLASEPAARFMLGTTFPPDIPITPVDVQNYQASMAKMALPPPPIQQTPPIPIQQTPQVGSPASTGQSAQFAQQMGEKQSRQAARNRGIGDFLKHMGIPLATAGIGMAVPGALPGAAGFQAGYTGEMSRQQQQKEEEERFVSRVALEQGVALTKENRKALKSFVKNATYDGDFDPVSFANQIEAYKLGLEGKLKELREQQKESSDRVEDVKKKWPKK